ncbi:MAG: fumarylacetoacetate hydrolase family protein [Ilumatobacteraceae bacterium]|nr:fumarylacetoacetate hydrolase family protein [Ilumatobacteraceae bacterium]
MRLATIRTSNGTICVRVDDSTATETGHADVGALLRLPGWRDLAADADGAQHEVASLDYAPLVTSPDKIICVGLNYLDHIAETGRERPTAPTLFPKFANSLVGANDPIELPRDDESTSVDWEAELGMVIGASVRRANDEQAAAAIAGYTVVNDISVRDFQNRTTQFMPGKAWERSTPVGPHLVVDEADAAPEFAISCEVDGVVMQSSNTRELCFGPTELIRYISTFTTLVPGDLIVTGTPGGVGVARDPQVFLQRGQTVVTRVDGVGECRNRCV